MNRSVLSNGLRVITVHRAHTPLAALKLFIKVGSRHDGPHPGISHFVEHMLFSRGPGGSPPAFQTIEGVGGEINAVTHREYTALQAVVLARHVPSVLGLFRELLAPLELSPERINREREVIVQEIERAGDTQTVIWDLFLQALWGDDPLTRPIHGTLQTVRSLGAADLQSHFSRYMAPGRMVLAAAGAVDHGEIAALAERELAWPAVAGWADAFPPNGRGSGRAGLEKDIQAAHLVVGVEGVGLPDARRRAVKLLDIILGRGASSRLHRRLRDELGLVYHASSVAMSYEDRGYLCAYTSCAPAQIPAVVEAVVGEFARIRGGTVTEEELLQAKIHYEGALARHFETVLSVASLVGIEELLHRIEPFEESVAQVQQVTLDEVHTVAGEIFDLDRISIATVGRSRSQAA